MPKIEVEESDFLSGKAVVDVVAKMMSNPAARRKVQEARKLVDPNAVIPEIDAAKPYEEKLDALAKALDEEKAARLKEKEEREASEKQGELKSRWSKGQAQ